MAYEVRTLKSINGKEQNLNIKRNKLVRGGILTVLVCQKDKDTFEVREHNTKMKGDLVEYPFSIT